MQWLMAKYLLWYIPFDHSQTGIQYSDFLKRPEFTEPIEQSIEKALALDPRQREWRAKAGTYYFDKKNYRKAWRHYQQVTDYIPKRYRVLKRPSLRKERSNPAGAGRLLGLP